jgi:hypothetical protein
MINTRGIEMLRSGLLLASIFLALPFLLMSLPGKAQSNHTNFWNTLADVTFYTKKVDGYEIELPRFGSTLLQVQGKKIAIKGYLIPMSESGEKGKYMLSSLPFSSCFFCGAAGPETVIELLTNQKINFTENAVMVEGVLLLNDSDINHHMYILKNAILKN